MTFRFAEPRDVDLLAEWNHQLIRDEGHRNQMTVPQLKERMSGWLGGEYKAVLFFSNKEPVAYSLYRENENEIYLRQLFVRRDQRNRGFGTNALEILRSKIWPAKRLTVEVLCANESAIRFYRRIGYQDYCLSLEIMPGGINETKS